MDKPKPSSMFADNMPPDKQVEKLAEFIINNYPQHIKGGGAVETAIQIINKENPYLPEEYKKRLEAKDNE